MNFLLGAERKPGLPHQLWVKRPPGWREIKQIPLSVAPRAWDDRSIRLDVAFLVDGLSENRNPQHLQLLQGLLGMGLHQATFP